MRLNLRSEVESSLTRVNGLPIAKLRKVEFVSLYCICICVLYLCNCKHLYLCLCHCIWKLLICINIFVFVYLSVWWFARCKVEEGGDCWWSWQSHHQVHPLTTWSLSFVWKPISNYLELEEAKVSVGEYHSIQIMPQLPFCARNRDNQENKSGSLQVFVKMDPNLKMPTIAITRPARYLALSKERLLFICWSVFCGQSLAVFKWADRWMAK